MVIKVENTFVVPAPPERAFRTLADPARVVPCMPGTELIEMLVGDRFRASSKLRAGPVELRFTGVGELLEPNDAKRTARLRARGSDAKGRGAFLAEIGFAVVPFGKAGARVRVQTDLTLIGTVAQFARGEGVVHEFTEKLTREFATNLAALIEAERIVQAVAARAAREPVLAPRAVETVGGPSTAGAKPASVRAPLPTPAVASDAGSEPAVARASVPLPRLFRAWNAVMATLRRWFGARP